MRYAEMESTTGRYRLLRLGSCDFEFDVVRLFSDGGSDEEFETVAEAVEDVFMGSLADEFVVSLSPSLCYSFLTSVQTGADEERLRTQVLRETTLVTDDARPLLVSSEELPGRHDDDRSWLQVTAVPQEVQGRLERCLAAFSERQHSYVPSLNAAAALVQLLELRQLSDLENSPRYSLTIGRFRDHAEFAVCCDGAWIDGHISLSGAPTDTTYFAVALLKKLGVEAHDVQNVYLYGTGRDEAFSNSLYRVFGTTPEQLNPLTLVGVDPLNQPADFDADAFVPCVGVTV